VKSSTARVLAELMGAPRVAGPRERIVNGVKDGLDATVERGGNRTVI